MFHRGSYNPNIAVANCNIFSSSLPYLLSFYWSKCLISSSLPDKPDKVIPAPNAISSNCPQFTNILPLPNRSDPSVYLNWNRCLPILAKSLWYEWLSTLLFCCRRCTPAEDGAFANFTLRFPSLSIFIEAVCSFLYGLIATATILFVLMSPPPDDHTRPLPRSCSNWPNAINFITTRHATA